MSTTKTYQLAPSTLIPNSRLPVIHYKSFFSAPADTGAIFDLYESNDWSVTWIFRYGTTQASHYHSRSHECMTVLTGSATIRFGAADLSSELDASTWGDAGSDYEGGGVEVHAEAGDVFVIPAGVAHKTFDTRPRAEFVLLTPGDGRCVDASDRKAAVRDTQLDGFTMMGAYPKGSEGWDFVEKEADRREWEKVWAVAIPDKDPVMGLDGEGIRGIWRHS